MAGERIRLEVQPREELGSAEARRLRARGLVPGVIYGRGKKADAFAIPERELRRALTGEHGMHAILDVVVDGAGAAHASILKDYQQDPVHGRITHVDLHEVRLDRPIQAQVSVALVVEPVGATAGGVLTQVTREVNVEALPADVPEHLELDVSEMGIGETLRLADLPVPPGVAFLDDPEETVLAAIAQPTRVEEPEERLEREEDTILVPQGEQAPQGGAEAPLEPGSDAAGAPGTARG